MSRDGKTDFIVEWGAILNDLGKLLHDAKGRSLQLRARSDDPRMISTQLFMRLVGHANAFAALFNHNLTLDAEIICRSAIEVAICMENLNQRGAAFVSDLRSDAAHTMKGQMPIWFSDDSTSEEDHATELRELFGVARADGKKHTRLAWQALADGAAMPQLYRWYRHLSATAAHVTGISVIQNVVPLESPGAEDQMVAWRRLRQLTALGMMCGASHFGCRAHAQTLGYTDLVAALDPIMVRMAALGPAELGEGGSETVTHG
jgi:hypothetical protein